MQAEAPVGLAERDEREALGRFLVALQPAVLSLNPVYLAPVVEDDLLVLS